MVISQVSFRIGSLESLFAVKICSNFRDRVFLVSVLPKNRIIRVLDLPSLRFNLEPHLLNHAHQRDPHVWLDPQNGNLIAHAIQDRLGAKRQNIIAETEILRLRSILSPYAKSRYLTHHDAFSHFSRGFGLSSGLSIRDASGGQKGARSQYLLRKNALQSGVQCVFVEPQVYLLIIL